MQPDGFLSATAGSHADVNDDPCTRLDGSASHTWGRLHSADDRYDRAQQHASAAAAGVTHTPLRRAALISPEIICPPRGGNPFMIHDYPTLIGK